MGRAPVVIVTNASGVQLKQHPAAFVDRQKLIKQGFKVDNIDGYSIVQDQLVLGVSKEAFRAFNEERKRKDKISINQLLDELINRLSVATKKTYEQPVPGYSVAYNGALWFWLMTQSDVNAMAKAFPGNRIKLTEWGFAF